MYVCVCVCVCVCNFTQDVISAAMCLCQNRTKGWPALEERVAADPDLLEE